MDIECIAVKNGWEIKKISEVTFFQEGPGVRTHQYTQCGVKLLNVANLSDGKVELSKSDKYISDEEAYGKYSHFLVDEGDLLIACSGIKVEYFEKKMGFVKAEHLPLCMNTSTMRFKSLDSKVLSIDYFAYFLKSKYFKMQIQRLITGSAQLNFGPTHIEKVNILIPSLPIQKKIVEVLDKARELIDLRKKQLGMLDDLVQSVFYEMFGDPVTNPKGWDIKKLSDVTSKITDGVHNKPDYTESGVPFISVKDISSGRLSFDDCKFISEKDHKKYIGRCKPERGDILYTKVGARYGIPAIVDTDREFSLYVSAALIKPKTNQINSMFLRESLKMPFVYRQAVSSIKGIGVPDLHLIEIKKFDIILPPINEQKKFENVVEKIEEQRCMMQSSLTEMGNTFNSLMQQAFSGELF